MTFKKISWQDVVVGDYAIPPTNNRPGLIEGKRYKIENKTANLYFGFVDDLGYPWTKLIPYDCTTQRGKPWLFVREVEDEKPSNKG